MRILISGAGPTGLTAAAALAGQGHKVTLIEKAQGLRAAGHVINLHENGLETARRLGILKTLQQSAIRPETALYLNHRDRKLFGYDCAVMERALNGELLVLPRDALIRALASSVAGKAEIRYATTLSALHQQGDSVVAVMGDNRTEEFDLVIGADGLHSAVRRLAFTEAPAPQDMGCSLAVWRMHHSGPLMAGITSRMAPGHQAMIWRMNDGEITVLLCWRQRRQDWSRNSAPAELAEIYRDMPAIAELIHSTPADRIHLARVEQLSLPAWSKGRVVLAGDSASCGSFFSGQGTSLGMAAGWILAEELAGAADDGARAAAMTRYESRMRTASDRMLRIGTAAARSFVPASATGLWLQSFLAPVIMHPKLLPLTVRRTMAPRLFP